MNKKYGPVNILSFRIYSMLSTQNLQIAEQMRHPRFYTTICVHTVCKIFKKMKTNPKNNQSPPRKSKAPAIFEWDSQIHNLKGPTWKLRQAKRTAGAAGGYLWAVHAEPPVLQQLRALHVSVRRGAAAHPHVVPVALLCGWQPLGREQLEGKKASTTQTWSGFFNSRVKINTALVFGGKKHIEAIPNGFKKTLQEKATNTLILHLGQYWPI